MYMEPLGFTLDDVYKGLLVVFRTGALLMTVPLFGHISIPRTLRVWIVLFLAFMISPSAVVSDVQVPKTLLNLSLIILSELAIGFSMGFTIIILFSAVQFAGHFIGLQMGLAVSSIIDPMGAGEISIIGEFYYMVSLLVFLLIDGHHFVLEALVQSFELIPLGGGVFGPNLGEYIVRITGNLFIIGIKLSAPVIVTLFIVNVVMGIVARTVPQMNVFIVGFPLAIGVGLILIRYSLPFFKIVFVGAFRVMQSDVFTIIRLMRG